MATTDLDSNEQNRTDERGRLTEATDRVRRSATEAYDSARERTGALYGNARERASRAYRTTRQGVSSAGKRTIDGIDANPVAALVGGLAVGAIAAALLPRTRGETRALGALGGKINQSAREAALTARDVGRDKLDELGFNRDGLSARISEFASSAGAAIRTSRAKPKPAGRKPRKG